MDAGGGSVFGAGVVGLGKGDSPMANPSQRQQAAGLLRFARKVSSDILRDFPESKYAHQRSPADNHPCWAMGHMVTTDAWMAGVLGIPGVKAPEGWDKLFGSGSKPVSDLKHYPAPAELKRQFEGSRAAILNWLESAPEAALAVSLKEKTGGFAEDPLDAMAKIAWHEGWHFGQVATLRKDLGLPPVM